MACEECSRNCQLVHGKKKDLSPSVSRFFKILIGDEVCEILCLPPISAKTISHLVGKDAKLEDSTGAQWTVTLSTHKGFLAFHKGWTKFAADHKLQIGELLVFNYLKNDHFVVQIFEHTCRERTEFGNNIRPGKHTMATEKIAADATPSQRNATNGVRFRSVGPSKQARPGRNLVKARTSLEMGDGDNRTTDTSDTNRESSSTGVPIESNFETPLNQPSTSNGPSKPKPGHEEHTYFEMTEFGNNTRPGKQLMTTEKIAADATPSQRNATNGVSFRSVGRCPSKQARPGRNLVKARTSVEMGDGDNRTTDSSDTNRESSSTSVPIESNFETSLNQPSTSNGPSKPKPGHEEHPCLDDASCVIMDRSTYYAETEKKVVLYDLSVFEMQKSEHISGKRCMDGEEGTHARAQKIEASRTEANLFEGNNTEPGFIGSMPVSKVPYTGMVQSTKAFRLVDNTGNCSKSPLGNGFASPLPRQVHTMDTHDKVVKKEQTTLREEASDHVQRPQDLKPSLIRYGEGPSTSRFKRKATKLEPDDSLDEPALFPDSITCLAVTDNSDFIELPDRLPSVACKKWKGRVDNRCSIVLLDPKGRRWPAIYRDKFGSSFSVICGWKRFNESNKIRPGDHYVFSLENGSQSTYKVDVVRT